MYGDFCARREHWQPLPAACIGRHWGLAVRRGPARRVVDPLAGRVAPLERQLAAATKRADRAEAIVAIQKKMAALFGDLPSSEPS